MNVADIFAKIKGNQKDIAEACGVTRQAVVLWKHKNRIPLKYMKKISELSGIPCHKISPDYFPKG